MENLFIGISGRCREVLLQKKSLIASILIYTLLSGLLFRSVDGNLSSVTSDFDFYNNTVIRGPWGEWVSLLARDLHAQSSYADPTYRQGWLATPFYSYLFLSPIWLFGSQLIFGVLGWCVGVLTLIGFFRLLRQRLKPLPGRLELMLMCLLPLNFNFLVDSLAVSTMSVAAMFVLLAISSSARLVRISLLVFAAMTRANYLIAVACAFIAILLIRPRGAKSILVDIFPSVVIAIVFYVIFYSTYPGSGLNYIFITQYQGLDYAQPMGMALSQGVLGIDSEGSLFHSDLGMQELFSLLSSLKAWAYVFNVWALKVSVTLGLVHEKLFVSDHGFWLLKAWRTIFFLAVTLPGVYASSLIAFSRNIDPMERLIYFWVLFYLAFNSLLIGDPRYLMGSYFFLALGLVRVLELISLSQKRLSSERRSF